MNEQVARQIATDALVWLAQDDEKIGGFLGVTGADGSDLRTRAADPEFLGFVLDYILSDDSLAEAFVTEQNLAPDAAIQARQLLPGGALPNWT